ncbi:hypothetical protein ENBRE01_0908 [Enteropsectra breve]|nr:hypothetical protein ENBRE01_0908 [Enteropsectra breve]
MAVSSFYKIEKIGEGTYGVVYKAKDRGTGKVVALKKIRPESENEGIPATTIREVLILKNLKHPSIINLMEVIHSDNKMYLVFEYIDTDLKKLIDKYSMSRKELSTENIKKMTYQLLSAIKFCHSKNILHRDIKPQNILVDDKLNVKLADFGLGRAASIPMRQYTTEIVTLWYRPPELLLGGTLYDSSIDIWSLGCIFVELCSLIPLFMGDSEIDQLYRIFRILGTPDNSVWESVEELPNYKKDFPIFKAKGYKSLIKDQGLERIISRILVYCPCKRITAEDALKDKYFEDVGDEIY